CGGIIRDNGGNLVNAYAVPLGVMTNNNAEAMALKCGLECYTDLCIQKLEIECDSKLLVE
ncbi:hypothetical protein HAX54_022068, partial [Datura stramonium]|nr:hypothetical protein [Datura stramonium]